MADTKKVLDMIKEHDVKYVDFRFTDPRGKWQHLAHHVRTITDEFLNAGFDLVERRDDMFPDNYMLKFKLRNVSAKAAAAASAGH